MSLLSVQLGGYLPHGHISAHAGIRPEVHHPHHHHHIQTEYDLELVKALSECYNNGVIDHTKIPRELPEHLRVPAIGVYAAAQPGAKPFDVAAGPIRLEGHLSGPHDHIIKGQVKLNLSAPIHKVLVNFEGDVSQDNGLENGWDIAGIGSGHIRVTLRGKKVKDLLLSSR
ncbi:hypothetical protein ABKN59_007100 [Abortiporus biennis]